MTTGSGGDFRAFPEVARRVRDLDIGVGVTSASGKRMLVIHMPLHGKDFALADTADAFIAGINFRPRDRLRGNASLACTARCVSCPDFIWILLLPVKLGVLTAMPAPRFLPATRPSAHTRQPPRNGC